MPTAMRGVIWFGTYVAVVGVPLIFAAIGVVDEDRGFWRGIRCCVGIRGPVDAWPAVRAGGADTDGRGAVR